MNVMVFCHKLGTLLLGVALAGTLTAAFGQTDRPTMQNLDFKQGKVGEAPDGWFVPTTGYAARLVASKTKDEKRSVVLASDPDAADAAPFGNLMQTFDATPYRGKRVRFRAAVRVEGATPDDRAQLWLRVDRPNSEMGFFNNMGDRPITAKTWDYYEIVGDVDADAESINLGLILLKSGKIWLRDVRFEIIGAPKVEPREPPRALTGRGLENLVAFTRMLGYVRHFYPGDAAAATNWERFAIEGVRAIEDAPDAPELAQRLQTLFRPVAPATRVFPTGQRPALPTELSAPTGVASLRAVRWMHHGFGTGRPQNVYRSEREFQSVAAGRLPEGFADPKAPYEADLGGGVSCAVPLTLYADAKGTLPPVAQSPAPTEETPTASGNDRATRLTTVALGWNIFQHFYPYFDVVQTDWPRALRDALTSAATDEDARAFLTTLRRMVAALHDGHGGVMHGSARNYALPPIALGWVEGQVVVLNVEEPEVSKLKPGDVILKLDGRPVAEALAQAEALTSGATPQWIRYRALRELGSGAPGSRLELEAQRGVEPPFTIALTRRAEITEPGHRPQPIQELRPGIWYVDLDTRRANAKAFAEALPKLKAATGIVFDLRGYPNEVAMALLPHLTDTPITSANWNIPVITYPDHQKMAFDTTRWPPMPPTAPRLKAKIAFLTDGEAISYAESVMGIVEYYKLGEIVGGPTAGTNGNVNPIPLPGGYTITWTGMKVTKHDGSQHHGVGIRPTVPVSPTLKGVAEGRDEVLERAVGLVSR